MVDETTYNELDRYFTGRMQGEERVAFEQRLLADTNLKTELDWIANATAAMKNSARVVMKQHIATAIAGVSAKALQKYQPAKNAKLFWKKWWFWVVAVTVVVAVSGAVLYANMWQGDGEYHFFNEPHEFHEQEQEHSAVKEVLMNSEAEEQAPVDSCIDEIKTDSAQAPGFDDATVDEKVVVRPQDNDIIYEVDTAKHLAYVATKSEVQKEKRMNTRINLRRQPPYAYFLDDNLTLYANYTSTAGFTFKGSGDTIYMTDNSAQTFMLLRGKGERPLVPLKAGAH